MNFTEPTSVVASVSFVDYAFGLRRDEYRDAERVNEAADRGKVAVWREVETQDDDRPESALIQSRTAAA